MKNASALLYGLAAAIWLGLGVMTFSPIYLGLALVFFVLAFKNRKRKDENNSDQ